jgi:hypothetical protein
MEQWRSRENGQKVGVIESCSVGCEGDDCSFILIPGVVELGDRRCRRGEGRNDWEIEREEPEVWRKKNCG